MIRTLAPIRQQLRHLRNAPRPALFHPHTDEEMTAGQRLAELVAARVGSWGFIGAQSLVMLCWVTVNTLALFGAIHFDSYPFVFLNLAMSAEAAFTGPILLIAANAGAQRDHKQAERMEHMIARIDELLEKSEKSEKPPRRRAS